MLYDLVPLVEGSVYDLVPLGEESVKRYNGEMETSCRRALEEGSVGGCGVLMGGCAVC